MNKIVSIANSIILLVLIFILWISPIQNIIHGTYLGFIEFLTILLITGILSLGILVGLLSVKEDYLLLLVSTLCLIAGFVCFNRRVGNYLIISSVLPLITIIDIIVYL